MPIFQFIKQKARVKLLKNVPLMLSHVYNKQLYNIYIIRIPQTAYTNLKSSMTNTSNLNLTKGTIPPLLKYKIVFLGDQAVGKSSIINRFIYDIFDGNQHRPTIGIDFISQNIFLEEKTIRLQLWDTAGQERFRSLIPNYIRDSSVAVIVYDVTNRISFKNMQKWIDDVKNQRGESAVIAILANKIDSDERDVTEEEGRNLAEENQVIFKQVSAKTGAGVQEFFKEIAALLPESADSTTRHNTRQENTKANFQVSTNKQSNDNRIVLNTKTEQEKTQVAAGTKKKGGCC